MAARNTGTSRVLNKLKASIEAKNYYEAHQMYRTIYFRYTSQKKYSELLDLLADGAVELLNLKQYNSGADLANLFVDVLFKSEAPVTLKIIEKLGYLHSLFAPNTPERLTFVARALDWSSSFSTNPSSDVSRATDTPLAATSTSTANVSTTGNAVSSLGHPELHRHVAINYWKEKNYADARYHFVHSTDGENCAAMLVELHTSKGYPSEVDLFIAQVVFHGKLAIFTVLCEQYQPCLKRDPSYTEYLYKIGQIFFGVPPPQPKQQGGILGNFLQSLMSGLDDDVSDEGNSPGNGSSLGNQGTSSTSSRQQQSRRQMRAEDLD